MIKLLRRVSAVLQWILALFLVAIALLMISYSGAYTYAWMSGAIRIVAIAMAVVIVLLIRKMVKRHSIWKDKKSSNKESSNASGVKKTSKKEMAFSGFIIFFLVMFIANIAYWNLFMFWKI